MKQYLKIVTFFIVFSFALIFGIQNIKAVDYITFHSDIQVSESRELLVKERYYVYFPNEVRGYVRRLPLFNTIYHTNGKVEQVSAQYQNPHFEEKSFEKLEDIETVYLKLFFPFAANQTEQMSVSYQYQYDSTKKENEMLYFDIVEKNHDGTVSNIDFIINLPKKISNEQVVFLIDGKKTDSVNFQINGNQLTGQLNDMLEANQSFSVRLEVEKGYFVGLSVHREDISLFTLLIPFISLVFSMIIWFYYKKKNKVSTKQIFLPPHEFDVAEVAYLYHGYTNNTDLTSLVIELANEGYLAVVETDKIQLVKLKDYDKNNAAEKTIFVNLFLHSNIVSLDDLTRLYSKFEEAKLVLDNEEHQKQIFTRSKIAPIIFYILLLLSSVSIMWTPSDLCLGSYLWSIPMGILLSTGLYFFLMTDVKTLLKGLIGLICLAIPILVGIKGTLEPLSNLFIFLGGILLVGGFVIGYRVLPRRSSFGMEMLKQMSQFRLTLLNLSSLQLQEIMKKSPSYFYEMLPYAYVFGLYENWMLKGKDLTQYPPVWLKSNNTFSFQKFYGFYKVLIENMTHAFMTLPSEVTQHVHLEQARPTRNYED